MTRSRPHLTFRSLAALAALTVAAGGGGLPMCVSLIARATTPCAMHGEHAGSPAHHGAPATVNASPSDYGSCHADAQSPGCTDGGPCPSGGTGTLQLVQALGVAAPDHKTVFAAAAAHRSFVAPPLAPPPQA